MKAYVFTNKKINYSYGNYIFIADNKNEALKLSKNFQNMNNEICIPPCQIEFNEQFEEIDLHKGFNLKLSGK